MLVLETTLLKTLINFWFHKLFEGNMYVIRIAHVTYISEGLGKL